MRLIGIWIFAFLALVAGCANKNTDSDLDSGLDAGSGWDAGTDAGGGENSDTVAPTITSTVPVADATEVSVKTKVEIAFSEPVEPSTLNTASFTLVNASGRSISGSVVPDSAGGTFTPDATLVINTTYTATISTAVTDLAGNPLAAPFSWSFSTHVGAWGTSELIEADETGDATMPVIGVDRSGNAVAVWYQSNNSRRSIWSNRYAFGTGWGTAELIETDDTGDAEGPEVAVDPSGNAIAVWYQSDGVRNNIWSNRYAVGTGWGTAERIETDDAGDAYSPGVAVDPSGNAVAVWSQSDGVRNNIWSNRYTVGTGWGTAERIETDEVNNAIDPRVAVDPSGSAIALWVQSDGTRYNVWSNRCAAGGDWGAAALVETNNAGDAENPEVAVDPAGNAVAVWSQSDGVRASIWSNRYAVGTGWGTAELIESDDTVHAEFPQVAVDRSGNAVVVWDQYDTRYDVWSNRYVAGTGWGTAEPIETDQTNEASYPEIGLDFAGNGVVVWTVYDTRENIVANLLQ